VVAEGGRELSDTLKKKLLKAGVTKVEVLLPAGRSESPLIKNTLLKDPTHTEAEALERSSATVIGAAIETLVYLANALDGAPVYVHLDLDVLDPMVMPAEYPADGGLPAEKLYDLLDAVADACEVVGIEITCLERPELAQMVGDTVAPVLAGRDAA